MTMATKTEPTSVIKKNPNTSTTWMRPSISFACQFLLSYCFMLNLVLLQTRFVLNYIALEAIFPIVTNM
jgi:hypothetical protein